MLTRNLKIFIVTVVTLFFSTTMGQNVVATSPLSDWTWPLDGAVVLINGLHSTTLENTDYDVKNMDLVHSRSTHLTCFDVGWHRLYHAGVDLYLPGGGTENAPVKSVANGTVVYFDSTPNEQSLIIEHTAYGVYSVYWHLKNVTVSVGNNVQKGQAIGQVTHHDYTGRFPQVHPFNTDDSHLHFEIRNFYDGGNKFPSYPNCNTGYPPGVGYTYPDSPDNYGYIDPIQFLSDRIPVVYSEKVFLPVVRNSASICQQGENLVQYNAGFEYSLSDPRPWFEASTYFEPALIPSATATLIPYPTLGFRLVTSTPTPYLQYLEHPPGASTLPKTRDSRSVWDTLFQAGRTSLIFLILGIWIVLMVWFAAVHYLDRR